MKLCKKCYIEKEITEFHKNKRMLDGHNPRCKKCACEYMKQEKYKPVQKLYRENNKEKRNLQHTQWEIDNKEYRDEYRKAYRRDNKEKIKESQKRSRLKHLEKRREENRKWNRNNPEKCRENIKNWKEENKDHVADYSKEYQKNNPLIKRVSENKRRAKKKSSQGSHTVEDIQEILKSQKHKCAYCKKSVKKKYHADHIIPLAKGGSNDRKNIQICCPNCNCRKHDKNPIDFARELGKLL